MAWSIADYLASLAKGVEDLLKEKEKAEAEANAPSDMTQQISKRAYELYEKGGRKDARADQDWKEAEREISKAGPKQEAKAEPKPEAKAEPKPEARAEPKPETKAAPKPEAKPEAKAKASSDLTPQIAKRAYELYEKRRRKEVPADQDWEEAEREIRGAEPKPEAKPEPKPEEPKP